MLPSIDYKRQEYNLRVDRLISFVLPQDIISDGLNICADVCFGDSRQFPPRFPRPFCSPPPFLSPSLKVSLDLSEWSRPGQLKLQKQEQTVSLGIVLSFILRFETIAMSTSRSLSLPNVGTWYIVYRDVGYFAVIQQSCWIDEIIYTNKMHNAHNKTVH